MSKRNIVVIGASAGGLEALKQLVAGLPADWDAAVFIVWHMAPDLQGIVPHVLNKIGTIPGAHAIDNESISFNRIYVAPPDHHLLIEKGKVRVTKGPKENRFRPAVDPLFRSAAYAYGSRVIGVVLSGALDDGTAGLWTIKYFGGTAVVQDPSDARVPGMPQNALREVETDHVVPVSQMAGLLVQLSAEEINEKKDIGMHENEKTRREVHIALQDKYLDMNVLPIGEPSLFACPECHGVLFTLKDGERSRYRCHTGHAYSPESLLLSVTEKIEDSLWNVLRGIDECKFLLNTMGDKFASLNQPQVAGLYFKKAGEVAVRGEQIRKVILMHEQLNPDDLQTEADNSEIRHSAS